MPTIDNKQLIDKLIAKDGYFEDDPQVYMIVEYTNAWGNVTWGISYVNERDKDRYLIETEYVRNPKVLWCCDPTDFYVHKVWNYLDEYDFEWFVRTKIEPYFPTPIWIDPRFIDTVGFQICALMEKYGPRTAALWLIGHHVTNALETYKEFIGDKRHTH
jgi:hypothetical protein